VTLRERASHPKRSASWTIHAQEAVEPSERFGLTGSRAEDIDVVTTVNKVEHLGPKQSRQLL
jgi:hypothetical protein